MGSASRRGPQFSCLRGARHLAWRLYSTTGVHRLLPRRPRPDRHVPRTAQQFASIHLLLSRWLGQPPGLPVATPQRVRNCCAQRRHLMELGPPGGPWKQLVRRINTDLPALIATHIQHHAPDLRRLTLAVHEVVREWHTLPQPACEGLDSLHGVPSLPTPSRLITAAHAIHDELMCILSSSLPKPTSSANCKMSRVASAWQACVLELRRLKRVIQADVTASHGLLRPWQVSLEPLQDLWAKAQSMTQHYQHRRVSPAAHMPPWDCFRTDPQRWARNLGFHDPDVLANIPTAVEPASPEASANCHSPGRVDSTDINWQVLLASGTTPSRCLARLDEWLNYVLERHTSQTSNYIRTLRQNRLQLLRQGDVSAWAKRMKPSSSPNPSYSPDWVTDDSGHKHRPTSRADVLVGAKQEWGRLLQEPTSCWQHDAVLPFSDVHQLRRGSINFQALSQAAPGSVLAAVCNAMLTSGPWRIVLLQAGQIRVINPGCIVAGSWVLYLRTFWEATLPGPCPGPTHFVVALDGSPHHTLTADQFQQASTRASHLLLRLAQPPDYSAVGPVSATEKRWLLAKFRNSRPGPSGWKICYIEAFCDAIQSTYWDCLNMLRLLGTAPPSLLYAEQVHLPKPAGGWRPLSMLEESLKAVEAPVISRLSSGRDPSLPDSPYSSLNRAYCKGVAAAAEVLYLDCLICEDAVRSGLPLLRIPADYEKFFNVLQLQEVDAMQQARGLPDAVRRLHQALFANMKVLLATRAGLTDPLPVSRGIPQGAVSSPEPRVIARSARPHPPPARPRRGSLYHQRWQARHRRGLCRRHRALWSGPARPPCHKEESSRRQPSVRCGLCMVQVLCVCLGLGWHSSSSGSQLRHYRARCRRMQLGHLEGRCQNLQPPSLRCRHCRQTSGKKRHCPRQALPRYLRPSRETCSRAPPLSLQALCLG